MEGEEGDWTVKVLQKQIKNDNFHLLAGYARDTAVTMVALQLMDGYSRVDHMITHSEHRCRGYARAIIEYLVDYHRSLSDNYLYLYASNPVAIRMYREAGFVEIEDRLESWFAWLPE